MKKPFITLLAVMAIVSCSQDDTPVDSTGSLSFVVSGSGPNWGADLIPEKLVVSVEDANSKTIFDNKVLTLTSSNNGYITETLKFDGGEYRITKFLVISGSTAAYATPRSGAEKASLVDQPLPLDFTVVSSKSNAVTPKIVGISPQDVPKNFGYGDFGYDTPGSESTEWINVRVKLEITVGGVYYPNIDATYTVRGFDENNTEVWTQNYSYIGPEANDLRVKNGYHHYSIEGTKWGKTLTQIFSRASLYEVRIREGEVPVTLVSSTDITPKKIGSTVTSFTRIDNGYPITEPSSKTEYEYLDGRVNLMKSYTWNSEALTFVEQSRSEFFYSGNVVKKIVTYDVDVQTTFAEDNYTYDLDGNVSHIKHKPSGNGVVTDVELVTSAGGRWVKAFYKFSNGTSFEYEVTNQFGSNKSDRTTRGGELCSTGDYTYDKNINPLSLLGYVDYLFRNYSHSNRVTENVNYVGCAFPSLMPESYTYVYDADGYPIKQETNYKKTSAKMIVEYSYVE
ncbi:MAG: hypothetical protein WDO14_16860 [Bacteroidota bacterium]